MYALLCKNVFYNQMFEEKKSREDIKNIDDMMKEEVLSYFEKNALNLDKNVALSSDFTKLIYGIYIEIHKEILFKIQQIENANKQFKKK